MQKPSMADSPKLEAKNYSSKQNRSKKSSTNKQVTVQKQIIYISTEKQSQAAADRQSSDAAMAYVSPNKQFSDLPNGQVGATMMSTPSDKSARSSLTGSNSTNYSKGAGVAAADYVTKVVVVDLSHGSAGKGKKSKRGKATGAHQRAGLGSKHSVSMANSKDFCVNDGVITTQTSSSNASIEMTPQRSKSEAPTENSIGNVLYEVHKKLMNRGRKLSPAKLQAKQQERQQKAEDLRAKIELSRKEWCFKVQQRQQLARARFQETVERKRLNLHERLEQAARNKEAELQNVVERAKAENVKAEETNFIIKLTKQNNLLDLNHKLSEREERRKMLASKDMARIKGQELKREAAEKRREELSEEMKFKVMTKEQKREQAEQRRKEQQIAEKNKAIADKVKRDAIRQRVRRHKISDIMSFVSNRESLWEFIGMEQDLDSMGLQFNLGDAETLNALDDSASGGVHNLNENELLSMIQQDQFELEKLMLKRDHEILSTCIVEGPDGTIKIIKNPINLLYRGGPKSSSSSSSLESTDEKKGPSQLPVNKLRGGATNNAFQYTVPGTSAGTALNDSLAKALPANKIQQQFSSPAKQSSARNAPSQQSSSNNGSGVAALKQNSQGDLRKLNYASKQNSQSFKSNQSSSVLGNESDLNTKDDIISKDGEEVESKGQAQSSNAMVSEFDSNTAPVLKEDEKVSQKLHLQRVKVAMRRNILKRNASEDLVWAAELQSNPNFEMVRFIGQGDLHHSRQVNMAKQLETRSQASSLERKSFDDLEDEIGPSLRESTLETPPKDQTKLGKMSAAHVCKRNKKQGKHNQSSRSSLHSSGALNIHGVSAGIKDLGSSLMNSNRGKRNSIQDFQQTFTAKQKKTLSNQGSCSSLSSLIKTKLRQECDEDFSDIKGTQTQGTLNQAQLEQLGPVVKMPINGFPFQQNNWVSSPSHQQQSSILISSSINQPAENVTSGILSELDGRMMMLPLPYAQDDGAGGTGSISHMAIHMNSLIIAQRPVPSKTNLSSVQYTNSNMSKNANQLLFPIREQKIILMYKERGPKLDFVQAKINLKIEEVRIDKDTNSQLISVASAQAHGQQQFSTPQQTVSSKKVNLEASSALTESQQISVSPATPQKSHRQSTKEPANGSSLLSLEEQKRTPTKAQNKMDTPNSAKKAGNSSSMQRSAANESSLLSNDAPNTSSAAPASSSAEGVETLDDSVEDITGQSDRMVNLIVKKLLVDQMQHIRIDDSQKSILFDKDQDSQAILKYLEVNDLKFGYCRLCEIAIYSDYSASDTLEAKSSSMINEHFMSKAHTRKRDSLAIKESEDTAYSHLVFSSQPGDINVVLKKENDKALKRKVKRLKASIQELAVDHENASTYPGKELKSPNKNRLQIRCIELQKSVVPDIKYDTVEAILNDVVKVLEKRGAGDLHLMRKLKFVPTMVDKICKRITTCPRSKLGALAKVINLVIKILSKFCTLRENRNYMIQTNRVMPLIELLSWCLNRQTELFFGIEFMPGLFQTITTHLKHRVPYECQLLKEHMVDLLICSSIPAKLKNKLSIVKSIQSNENEDTLGQVPFFLLKSIAFLEALTAMISIDARTRPVYEKSTKIGEHVFYVLQSTELLGITQMITTLLLTCNETFKASAPSSASSMVLPQTILSLTIFSIKVLNNLMRMDVGIVQHMMLELNESLYHLLSFILSYTETNIDESDDVKELLHETLIFIGYFCLLNEGNQKTLQRGENSILQRLCNLPFTYFMDKKLKDILFPTLVTASYHNDRSVAIMDQEMNMTEYLVKYIETNIAEELPKIMEQEQEYFSDHTKSMSSFGRTKSPSQHSTGSNSNQSVQMDFLSGNNPYLPLVMRFPKNLWKDASQYYKSKAD